MTTIDDLELIEVEPASEPALPPVRALYESQRGTVAGLGLVGAVLGVLTAVLFPAGPFLSVGAGAFAAALPLLAWTDQKTLRLPNKIMGPVALVAIAAAVLDSMFGFTAWSDFAWAAGTGLGLGFLLFVIAVVSNGLGMGDVKFVALAGFVIGFKSLVAAMAATFIIAPIVAVIWVSPVIAKFAFMRGREPGSAATMGKYKFAYGPHLIAGALIGLLVPTSVLLPLVGM